MFHVNEFVELGGLEVRASASEGRGALFNSNSVKVLSFRSVGIPQIL
jgi:hypothetical protein